MDYRALAADLLSHIAFQKTPTEEHSQLSSGEQGILHYLHFVKNGAFAGEISHDVGISTGRTAIALKSLEKKGLVERGGAEKDRRRVIVRITKAGIEAAEGLRNHVLCATEEMLRMLGESDAREYVRIVKRIIENYALQTKKEKPSP